MSNSNSEYLLCKVGRSGSVIHAIRKGGWRYPVCGQVRGAKSQPHSFRAFTPEGVTCAKCRAIFAEWK